MNRPQLFNLVGEMTLEVIKSKELHIAYSKRSSNEAHRSYFKINQRKSDCSTEER